MEKPHTNKRQNARGWVLAALLCVVILAYSSIYFANTMPITEGWNVNYAELVLHGKFPYRDFYYYLPPLNILIDVMLWKLSFGSLFIYRAWWLVQRIAIYELMFRLLCRYFNRYAAFAACAFSAILCTASVYDLFGDYNQTIPFCLCCCSIVFWDLQRRQIRKPPGNTCLLPALCWGCSF